MLKIKTIDDYLGVGFRIKDESGIHEARNLKNFQTRIHKKKNKYATTVRIPSIKRSDYKHFKVLTDRLNSDFDINISNKKQDFVCYLNSGLTKIKKDLQFKINLKDGLFTNSLDKAEMLSVFLAGINGAIVSGMATGLLFLYNILPADVNAVIIPAASYGGLGAGYLMDKIHNKRKEQEVSSFKDILKLKPWTKTIAKYENLLKQEDKLSLNEIETLVRDRDRASSILLNSWHFVHNKQFARFYERKGITMKYNADSYKTACGFLDYIVNNSSFKGFAKPMVAKVPAEEIIEESKELPIIPQAISS